MYFLPICGLNSCLSNSRSFTFQWSLVNQFVCLMVLAFVSTKLFSRFSIQVSLRIEILKHILKGPDHKYFRAYRLHAPQIHSTLLLQQKQLLTVHKQLGMAVFPHNFLYKNMQLPLPAPAFKRLIVLDYVFRFMIHVEVILGYNYSYDLFFFLKGCQVISYHLLKRTPFPYWIT